MRLRATSSRVTGGGDQLSRVARMIKAIRMLGGSLWMPDQRAFGDGEPNLLTAPEDFDGTGWAKTATTVLRNAATALDGSLTADKLVATSISAQHYANMVSGAPVAANAAGTFSVFAKSAEQTSLSLSASGSGSFVATFNLATGVVTAQLGGVASIVDFGSGWYRCIFTCTTTAFAFSPYIFPVTYNGYTGDGVSGVYVWGAKLEPGTVATPYTPQSVLSVRGAYTGITGTTPVTAVADLLGLLTDRSYGSANFGVELFSGTYITGTATTATYIGREATATFNGVGGLISTVNNWLSISGTTAIGTYSVIEYWATWVSGGDLEVGSTWQVGDTITAVSNGGVKKKYTTRVRSPYAGISYGPASFSATSAQSVWKIEIVSVREVLGQHATQSAVASKPTVQRVPKRLALEMIASQDLTTWTSGGAFGNWAGTTSTSTMITTTGVNGGRYVRLPCTPGKTYTVAALVAAGTGQGSVAIAYGTSGNALISEQTGTFTAAGVARVTTVAPANAAFVEFVIRGGTQGQTTTFTALTAGEVTEWACVISFDGNNDFLQTGITAGNEGWLAAGVTLNNSNTAYLFYAGANNNAEAGVTLRSISGEAQLLCGDGVARDVAAKLLTVGAPLVLDGGWTPSSMTVAVNGVEASQAKTRNCNGAIPMTLGAASGSFPTSGPVNAFVRSPVFPDAASRRIIRDGIAALQGRGPL